MEDLNYYLAIKPTDNRLAYSKTKYMCRENKTSGINAVYSWPAYISPR